MRLLYPRSDKNQKYRSLIRNKILLRDTASYCCRKLLIGLYLFCVYHFSTIENCVVYLYCLLMVILSLVQWFLVPCLHCVERKVRCRICMILISKLCLKVFLFCTGLLRHLHIYLLLFGSVLRVLLVKCFLYNTVSVKTFLQSIHAHKRF